MSNWKAQMEGKLKRSMRLILKAGGNVGGGR